MRQFLKMVGQILFDCVKHIILTIVVGTAFVLLALMWLLAMAIDVLSAVSL